MLLSVRMYTQPGNTTPTDSRSQRIRASRKGGQLLTRARSSSFDIGLPVPRVPAPLSRMVAPYTPLAPKRSGVDATYFIRGTNAIESTFATVRLRTNKTKGAGSRNAGLTMAYKLLDAAQARWRCVNAPHLVALVRAGATFVDGSIIEREDQRYAA